MMSPDAYNDGRNTVKVGGKRSRGQEDAKMTTNVDAGTGGGTVAGVGTPPLPSWEALLHPNFEELARQFPSTFGQAWKEVEGRRVAAIQAWEHEHLYHQPGKARHPPHTVTALETYMTPTFGVALTRALLHQYFGLALPALPAEQYLCPPVPNRYFLVDWIHQTLLPRRNHPSYFVSVSTPTSPSFNENSSATITGLDIGTGASCIYPLLYCAAAATRRQQPQSTASPPTLHKVYATDVDAQSIALAGQNIHANHLSDVIVPFLVPPSSRQKHQQQSTNATEVSTPTSSFRGPYRQSLEAIQATNHGDTPSTLPLSFCLTNPPFDDTTAGLDDHPLPGGDGSRRRDGRARTPLTSTEGWYPGGEAGFISDIFADQLLLMRCGNNTAGVGLGTPLLPSWTVSMCGKKTTWERLVHGLQVTLGISHIDTTEFGPGHHVRWFVAWTWDQPVIRSPLASSVTWDFEVVGVVTEMVIQERLASFCEFKQEWGLTVSAGSQNNLWHITEKATQWQDQLAWLPNEAQQALEAWDPAERAKVLLPPEGHFIVDLTISQERRQNGDMVLKVSCHAYCHSLYAKRRVSQIQSVIGGEVGQTNRRWRRKHKTNHEARNDTKADPMDESA